MNTLDTLAKSIVLEKQDFLFIGPSGVGKTYAAEHLHPPALFINADGGLRTVAKSGTGTSKEIDIRTQPDPFSYFINTLIPILLPQTEYKTLVIDSITALSELFYRKVAGVTPNPSYTLKNYGTTIDQLRQIVSKLKTAKANVIYTATEIGIPNDTGGIEAYIPNVAGKETFARQLPAYMDQVWFFIIKSTPQPPTKDANGKMIIERRTERKILTAPTGQRIGKDRDGVLLIEEEINFEQLRQKLQLI